MARKNEERYNAPAPVVSFCLRYKSKTGSSKYDAEAKKRVSAIFPKGTEKAALADFHEAPALGVAFKEENDRLLAAGLKKGDVIVALNHVHIYNLTQYDYLRDISGSPMAMEFIVWQGDSYREIKASPPNHRFGVTMENYRIQKRSNGENASYNK